MIRPVKNLPHVVLGIPFLHPFVQFYNVDDSKLTLITHEGELEDCIFKDIRAHSSNWTLIAMIMIVMVIISSIVVLIAYRCRMRKRLNIVREGVEL